MIARKPLAFLLAVSCLAAPALSRADGAATASAPSAADATTAIDRAPATAENLTGAQYLREAQSLFQGGQYFRAARYAFAAKEQDPSLAADAYSWMAAGLSRARLPNAASYFFIRTMESGNRGAIRRALGETQFLFSTVGADLFRKYLIKATTYEDYDAVNRSAYLYALAKDALLAGQNDKVVGYVGGMSSRSPLWPHALQLRATAEAILGRNDAAVEDFRACRDSSGDVADAPAGEGDARRKALLKGEGEDLAARCQAGIARTLYQMDQFDEADQAYDRIAKGSLVWPDILFEQAWNSFARQEYNRTLGKLVSYHSPALQFVYNSEADVLRAQSYLSLCLNDETNASIDEFNNRYSRLGEEVKRFVEGSGANLDAFYDFGRAALRDSLYTQNGMHRLANRFIRGPYFRNLVFAERAIGEEESALRLFSANGTGAEGSATRGFPGFLSQVLRWRVRTVHQLGGTFVKNSLMDYHASLIADFEKMSFIKLEMLRRAKEALVYKNRRHDGREWGSVEPSRRPYQYYWSFNGEFWNDELGDYVFGLESECRKNG